MAILFRGLNKKVLPPVYAAAGFFLFVAMLSSPRATFEGAAFGLELWATVLVPSLLPFFILADIIIQLGLVQLLGVLLEPLMRPVFNLPGEASFAIAMGLTSGFPMGAVITRGLYEKKLCTKEEGERLVAFTNNSSFLFIMAATAVGMFDNQLLGVILALAHYSSNLILGFILGLLAGHNRSRTFSGNRFKKFMEALYQAQKNRAAWGQLLGDAVRKGINNILLIGGFIVLFSVVIRLLQDTVIQHVLEKLFLILLSLGGNPELSGPLSCGFWEITLGLKTLSLSPWSLTEAAVAASVILAWSGLCIQAQVAGVLSGSDISPRFYFAGRIPQCLLAGVIAFFLAETAGYWSSALALPALIPTGCEKNVFLLAKNYFVFVLSLYKTGLLILASLTLLSVLIPSLKRN